MFNALPKVKTSVTTTIMTQNKMNRTQTHLMFQAGLQWACSQEIYQNPWKILECAEHRVLGLSSSYPSVF